MDRQFTRDELQTAARQAITLALSAFGAEARESLLKTAERMMAEAKAMENAAFGRTFSLGTDQGGSE
jgi:hypothetical protein